MKNKIPIIDLFAGPGGLGEGFMSLKNKDNKSVFDIKLSIEKDINAHKTLTLRSFYRQFSKNGKAVPEEYYNVLKEVDLSKREILIREMLDRYKEGEIARKESRLIKLGSEKWPAEVVDKLIKGSVKIYQKLVINWRPTMSSILYGWKIKGWRD